MTLQDGHKGHRVGASQYKFVYKALRADRGRSGKDIADLRAASGRNRGKGSSITKKADKRGGIPKRKHYIALGFSKRK